MLVEWNKNDHSNDIGPSAPKPMEIDDRDNNNNNNKLDTRETHLDMHTIWLMVNF